MKIFCTGILMFCALMIHVGPARSQGSYFPPLNPAAQWDTVSPASLGWCTDKIAPLYDYLSQENTKGFIVLKNGKIALEKYFGTFMKDSLWYWASAGKTLTAFLVGKAQEDGFFAIGDSSSKYLGAGWTICTPEQEGKITIRNQLTMTTGLDDGVPDNHCTLDTCLEYLTGAGTRWAYHNAAYTLLEKVLVNATGISVNILTQAKLLSKTGMTGFWLTIDYDNVFFSTARSMARFGLLAGNGYAWNTDTLLRDTAYLHQMINTSQPLNKSYGYLWWLNGNQSFMLPGTQFVFPGSWAPHAPADMYAGLGKNGQIVSISPSKGIVMVRMGNPSASSGSEIPGQLCDQVWQRLNEVMCNSNGLPFHEPTKAMLHVFPNPAGISFKVILAGHHFDLEVTDLAGRKMVSRISVPGEVEIDCSKFRPGVYFVKATTERRSVLHQRIIVRGIGE